MKLKKKIAVILLSFANILLLAHSVTPHHHHDGLVSFIGKETIHLSCQFHLQDGDRGICTGSSNEASHGHDADSCDLKVTILRQADQSLQHNLLHSVCCLSSLYYTDYYINSFFIEGPDFGLRSQAKPYIETYISPFVGTISGLRAPPVYFLG